MPAKKYMETENLQLNQKELASLKRLLSVAGRLDQIGLLDLIEGMLDDQETVGRIVNIVTSDRMLSLYSKRDELFDTLLSLNEHGIRELLDILASMDRETLSSLFQLLDQLERRGLIQLLSGILGDEESFSRLVKFVSSDAFLTLLSRLPSYLSMLNRIEPEHLIGYLEAIDNIPYAHTSIQRSIEVLSLLGSRGFLDLLEGILQDEQAISSIVNLFVSDKVLQMIPKLGDISDLFVQLSQHIDALQSLISMMDNPGVRHLLKGLSNAKGEIAPVRGTFAVMHQLGDKDVAQGLGVIFEVLKQAGKEMSRA
ncbi:MAG: DUF1641 domain-containing protein [Methanomassiliicoccales archaeon]